MWFGKNLKFLRKRAEMSLEDVARITGKTSPTVQRWEAGINEPNLGLASKIATVFRVNLQDMCDIDLSASSTGVHAPCGWYPEIPEGVSAGALSSLDPLTDLPRVSVPDFIMGKYAHAANIVFMHVNGASMDRVIPDGSVIAVLRGIERGALHNGDPVVATNGREYTIKRYFDDPGRRRLVLRPDSCDPGFVDIIIPYDSPDSFTIYGKVVIYPVYL